MKWSQVMSKYSNAMDRDGDSTAMKWRNGEDFSDSNNKDDQIYFVL